MFKIEKQEPFFDLVDEIESRFNNVVFCNRTEVKLGGQDYGFHVLTCDGSTVDEVRRKLRREILAYVNGCLDTAGRKAILVWRILPEVSQNGDKFSGYVRLLVRPRL